MKKIVMLVAIIMIMIPLFAFAQATQTTPCTVGSVQQNPDNKLGELPRCVNQIYIWSLGIGSLLALLMMVVGGYYYMTSSGNAEQSSKGVEMIWGAVIGLALLFGAYLLLNTINPDLVNFKINSCLKEPNIIQRNLANPPSCGSNPPPTPTPPSGPRNP